MVHEPSVLVLVLSGGRGQRLYPLTKTRAKGAVPFGGKFRLIDVAVSNCLNSGFKRIFILTQWVSSFLHNYITRTYRLDTFDKAFIEILAAEQTFEHTDWYQGTADAIRQSWSHFRDHAPTHYLIVSSDQLYRMNLREFLHRHLETGSQITLSAIPVTQPETEGLGVMKIDAAGRVRGFLEKPEDSELLRKMKIPQAHPAYDRAIRQGKEYLASMGIYLFDASVLEEVLCADAPDFGRDVLPRALAKYRIGSYVFFGYWKDVGTIGTYYRTSLSLASLKPDFNVFDEEWPIYSNETGLPATKLNSCVSSLTLTAEGCIVTGARLQNCVIGPRMIIEPGAFLDGVICMGNDRYETDAEKAWNRGHGIPNLGIGRESLLRRTIVDENARIGSFCRIGIEDIDRPDCDTGLYSVRDGIIVIHEGAIIPDRTVI